MWISANAVHQEGDVGITKRSFLLCDLIEVRLVWKVSHRCSGSDAIKKFRVRQKLTTNGAAK